MMYISIDERFLYDFTSAEKRKFYLEVDAINRNQEKYEKTVKEFIKTDSPKIFGNYERHFSRLEVRYTLNRLQANDPSLKMICLGDNDWVVSDDAFRIAKAIQGNEYCTSFNFPLCHFQKEGTEAIVSVLKGKRVDNLDLRGNIICEETVQIIADELSKKESLWKNISLGFISLPQETISLLPKEKVSYENRPDKPIDLPKREIVAPIPIINHIFPNLFRKIFGSVKEKS